MLNIVTWFIGTTSQKIEMIISENKNSLHMKKIVCACTHKEEIVIAAMF